MFSRKKNVSALIDTPDGYPLKDNPDGYPLRDIL